MYAKDLEELPDKWQEVTANNGDYMTVNIYIYIYTDADTYIHTRGVLYQIINMNEQKMQIFFLQRGCHFGMCSYFLKVS